MKRNQRTRAIWIAAGAALAMAAIVVPLLVFAGSEKPAFTATLYSDVIRFESNGVASLRVTIYDLSENELWSSGQVMSGIVDWDRANARGERLANGYYMYLAQGWDGNDRLVLNKAGKVVLLPGDQVELKALPSTGRLAENEAEAGWREGPIAVGPLAVDQDHSTESWSFLQVGIGNSDPGATGLRITRSTNSTTGTQIGLSNSIRFGDVGTGAMSGNIYGLWFNAETLNTYPGDVSGTMIGIKGVMNHKGTGTLSDANGIMCQVNNIGSGTIQTARGLVLQNPSNSGGGTITHNYGLLIGNMSAGTTSNYAVYSLGGRSYFEDEVGIGTANATDKLTIQASSGNLIACYPSGSRAAGAAVFRVEADGDVYADGTVYSDKWEVGAADVAERINASEWVEAGDVVEIDPEHAGFFRKARGLYSRRVAGIVSTSPGVILGNDVDDTTDEWDDGRPVLAIAGRVPVKVSSENGSIAVGDLLVSSSVPGVAMRGNPGDSIGAVVGKAMELLASGEGTIMAQVTLR